MIDLSKIQYRLVVMDEKGKQYNIKDFVENLGWEENDGELAMRSSFTVRNDKTSKGYLSSIIKPGCLIGIFATDGGSLNEEVARGYVEVWNPVLQNSADDLKCTNYDELYKLQQSQDNLYFSAGTGTKSAIQGILDEHQIPQGDYKGPNATHGKLKFNNKYLADVLLELLDDAYKRGEEKCLIRASKGYTHVLPWGSNTTVYVFRADNTKSVSNRLSTEKLVTRVKVVGQADEDGNRSVEATLNGQTKFGIRQKIYTRGSDEDLSAAKSAAQNLIKSFGYIHKLIKGELNLRCKS